MNFQQKRENRSTKKGKWMMMMYVSCACKQKALARRSSCNTYPSCSLPGLHRRATTGRAACLATASLGCARSRRHQIQTKMENFRLQKKEILLQVTMQGLSTLGTCTRAPLLHSCRPPLPPCQTGRGGMMQHQGVPLLPPPYTFFC